MRFPADKNMMALDPYHALARYIIVYSGFFSDNRQPYEESRWVFPHLYGQKDVSTMLTNVLHDLAEKNLVAGLTQAHTSHGVKQGAIDDICFAHGLSFGHCKNRAGYEVSESGMATGGGNLIGYVSMNRGVLESGK